MGHVNHISATEPVVIVLLIDRREQSVLDDEKGAFCIYSGRDTQTGTQTEIEEHDRMIE